VVLLNTVQQSKVRVLIPLRKCYQRYSRTCGFTAKMG